MNYKDILKIIVASIIILIVAIYPILDIPIPDIVMQGFGSVVVFVLGVATSLEGDKNE